MARHEVAFEVGMVIIANEAGEAAINRYVGLTPEQAAETSSRPGMTRDEVERSLCTSVLYTGNDPDRLDGWADLEPGDLNVHIDYVQEA